MAEQIGSLKDGLRSSFNEQRKVQAYVKSGVEAKIQDVGADLRQEMKGTLEAKLDKCHKKCEQLEARLHDYASDNLARSRARVSGA